MGGPNLFLHHLSPSLPLDVGPLNIARRSGSDVSCPSGVWGKALVDQQIWFILALNLISGGTNFTNFPVFTLLTVGPLKLEGLRPWPSWPVPPLIQPRVLA